VHDLDPVTLVDAGLLPVRAAHDLFVYFNCNTLRNQSQLAHQLSQNDLIMIQFARLAVDLNLHDQGFQDG